MPNGVEFEGRLAHVGTFPIGIDPDSFIAVSAFSASFYHKMILFDMDLHPTEP